MSRLRLRRPRGYVLIMVLAVILVLSVALASVYTQSSESLYATDAMVGQKVASARADLSAQMAVAFVKLGGVTPGQFVNTCTGPGQFPADTNGAVLRSGSCTGPDIYASPFMGQDGGTNYAGPTDGWQYRYWIYRRVPASGTVNPNMVNIYAEGYYGRGDLNTGNFAVAAIEAEVLVPLPAGGTPTYDGDYNIYK